MPLAMNKNRYPSDISTVGHHFLLGLQKSVTLTSHDIQLLSTLTPAGIILYRENFKSSAPYEEWLAALRELIQSARALVGRETLLVSIDHEGGAVFRPPPPITNFGCAAAWAQRSGEVGTAMGIELRSLGINLDYCPVVDIHTNPTNPVIGTRAFGSTAEEVSKSAGDFLAGLEREGVIGCPKHFPGHGDTSVDSHYGLPIVERSLDDLRQRELLPFAAMVKAGAKIIMSAHILNPRVDPEHPATLSRIFLNDVLRGELGFGGVITTDDVGMGAVSKLYDTPGAAVSTLQAGCDLIMISAHWTDTDRAMGFAQDILDGLSDGTLNSELFEASQDRIKRLLSLAPAHPIQPIPSAVFAAHGRIASQLDKKA